MLPKVMSAPQVPTVRWLGDIGHTSRGFVVATKLEHRPASAERGGRQDAVGEPREVAGVQLLRAVAQGLLGVLVDLDDDAVGADRCGPAGQRLDEAAVAGRVAGVDD